MSGRILRVMAGLALAAIFSGTVAGVARAEDKGADVLVQMESAFVSLAEKVRPAVVSLSPYIPPPGTTHKQGAMPTTRPINSASGVIIDGKKGLVVTNSHVVRDTDRLVVTLLGGEEMVGRVVGFDEDTDLAIVQVEVKGQALPEGRWGDSTRLKVGQLVVAVGNPYGLHDTMTLGIISGLNRENVNLSRYEDFIQTDASINPGNSGGPLLNIRGEIIGINTAIINYAQNIGFAIPSNVVREIARQIAESGRVRRGWLGIGIEAVTQDLAGKIKAKAGQGVFVNSVFQDEPAYMAGIREGDVILKIGGAPVDSPNNMIRLIGAIHPGQKVSVDILRAGQLQVVTVDLGARRDRPYFSTPAQLLVPALGFEISEPAREANPPAEEDSAKGGVIVSRVVPESPADRGGLKSGDVLVSINGQNVESMEQLKNILSRTSDKEDVKFGVSRKKALLTVNLHPGT